MIDYSRTPPRKRHRQHLQTGLFFDTESTIVGTIERVRYRADDTGFSVLVVQPEKEDAPQVTMVGHLSGLQEGDRVEFEGEWKEHPRFGRQFQVTSVHPMIPTTSEGIEKFLASGTIKNIGPVLAKRIVNRFGEQSLEIIENEPQRLLEIPGLGPKKLNEALESWKSQSEVKEVLLFLQSFDVPLYLAEKIFRTYGSGATLVLRENPYRLASDIYGVGFQTADRIAQKMGIPPNSPSRCAAGVLYVLDRLAEREGHLFIPYSVLSNETSKILDLSSDMIESAFRTLQENGAIVIEDLENLQLFEPLEDVSQETGSRKVVYSQYFHSSECEVARRIVTLHETPRDEIRMDSALRGKGVHGETSNDRLSVLVSRSLEGGLATNDQARAILSSLLEKVLVVTGGPGTGKTTVINAVTQLYNELGLTVLLCAPTGRAAKRLSEVSKQDAFTIHRMLEFSWTSGGFIRGAENPLPADVVIVDEASMVDIHLMNHLLRAIPNSSSLIMVGDVDQLPSVGPGNVLRDLLDSGVIPVVRLNEVFRQAKESYIVENAHRLNRGEMPREPKGIAEQLQDYYFIEENDPERCAELIVELCQERIPERFGLDPINEVQVISPMQRGSLGVQRLNLHLQEALNPAIGLPSIQSGGRSFRERDKLLQIRNNYEKNVFNGDIGIVRSINPTTGSLIVDYDYRSVEYTKSSLDEVMHAYAVTVHKSQGSEYPAVVIPLHTQHYPMLQRNLVYTALTRARRLAIFVGSKKALAIAVRNAKVRRRWSYLSERVRIFNSSGNSRDKMGKINCYPGSNQGCFPPKENELPHSNSHVEEHRDGDSSHPPRDLTYHPYWD